MSSDEVQVIDWGRTLFAEPRSDWSLSWLPSGKAATNFGFLGPGLQDLAFRASAGTPWGPRLSALAGALLAATGLVIWLGLHRVSRGVALLAGLSFLWHPSFVQAYRGARVDGWAMAAAIWAAVWLHHALAANGRRRALLAGVLLGITPLLWPTGLLTAAITGFEAVEAVRTHGWQRVVRIAALGAAGFASVLALALAFYLLHIGNPLADAGAAVGVQVGAANADRLAQAKLALTELLRMNPWLWLACLGAAASRRSRSFLVWFALAMFVALVSRTYIYRVIYVVPLLCALAAFSVELDVPSLKQLERWARLALVGSCLWCAGVSLLARNALAFHQRDARSPAHIDAIARAQIGKRYPRQPRVLLGAVEFYYVGRRLGWRMYIPYMGTSPAEDAKLLDSMDVAIGSGDADAERYQSSGLLPIAHVPRAGAQAQGYGAYTIYARR